MGHGFPNQLSTHSNVLFPIVCRPLVGQSFLAAIDFFDQMMIVTTQAYISPLRTSRGSNPILVEQTIPASFAWFQHLLVRSMFFLVISFFGWSQSTPISIVYMNP